MRVNLLDGNVTKSMLLFSIPMILGNLLQQLYNIADTLIVGRFIGADALAAVGSSFTLMTFLTSVILGLCMVSGVAFSMCYGAKKEDDLKSALAFSFLFIAALTLLLTAGVLLFIDPIIDLLQIPAEIREMTQTYLRIIFYGMVFTFFYNYFASVLRAFGNSLTPLIFLGISAVLNIALDLCFVLGLHMGVAGAAWATVLSQAVSAAGVLLYCLLTQPILRVQKKHLRIQPRLWKQVIQFSILTSVQQSIMNFGILMIQGLVNSFGVAVMAAFAAAVKIDSFAYMPVQDFGNAFSTFIAQNSGAGKRERIQRGIRSALAVSFFFCIVISAAVWCFAGELMKIFVDASETEIIAIGVGYLRIEGTFYFAIGCLFLLYGLYRGVGRPGISIVLTVISLGMRVLLAYCLAPTPIGLAGIWWAIPIGWILADAAGLIYYRKMKSSM